VFLSLLPIQQRVVRSVQGLISIPSNYSMAVKSDTL
jgi:hypothetical protein